MFATYRDSLRELNQGDLGLLETRFRTMLVEHEVKLQSSLSDKHWDLVKWMFTFFGAYVVWTATLVVIIAAAIRR
jgi:sulfur relay (sulfurtransferase) DsrC/TusE family protein